MPGVQKPHCRPWVSRKACCSGWSSSGLSARPSTVCDLVPSAWTASIRQERTGSPSSSTVQAPQTPCSQPTWVPVRPQLVAQEVAEQQPRLDLALDLASVDGDAHRGAAICGDRSGLRGHGLAHAGTAPAPRARWAAALTARRVRTRTRCRL